MNKKRVVSTLFLYLLIFSLGCDFESPQKWETPSWYLPLTIPLVNTVYSFEGMAQDSTIIEDSLNNTLNIVFSNNIADEGARPGIDSTVFDFVIPSEGPIPVGIDFSFPGEPIVAPEKAIEIPEEIGLQIISLSDMLDGIPGVTGGGCLPVSALEDFATSNSYFPLIVQESIPILGDSSLDFSSFELDGESIIQDIHAITVSSGRFGTMVDNKLPFLIINYSLEYISYQDGNPTSLLTGLPFENIAYNDSDSSIVKIGSDETSNPPKDIVRESQEFGDSLNINLLVEMDFTNGPDMCKVLNPQTLQVEDVPGWQLQADLSIHKLTIRLDFTIDVNGVENIICTTNPMVIDTTMKIAFPKIDNIEVKGGKVTSEFLEDITNSIKLSANNSLYTGTNIDIRFNNFFNEFDEPLTVGGLIDTTGRDTSFIDALADYFLGVPGEPDSILKSIEVEISLTVNAISKSQIGLGGTVYGLQISEFLMSDIELAYLTAVTYDMDFDTPSSNIEGVPQGGVGFQFYDVQLILDIYTQIGIPIQLDMLLKGLKGEDSVLAVINPELNVPEINTTGDSVRTIITLNRDGQTVEWYNMDNIDGEIPDSTIFTPLDDSLNSIVDVMNFAPDILEFGGGAKINGAGFLAPNSLLWGTFILVAPLAFIFEQPINIIPAESTPMSPMDPSTSQQIDSALVEAALNVTITNNSPLGGSLSLLISDSTIFPLFLDSLTTGTWVTNQQNQFDKYGYNFNTAIWDTLRKDLTVVIDSVSVIPIDSTDENTKALEVKFYRDDSLQFFIGRMFELEFPRADSIEYHLGYVNPEFPNIHISNIAIDTVRMDWVFTDESRYNVSMMTFDSSPIQSITDTDTEYIPLTFQTTNTIGVQAYFTLKLDIGGLGRDSNSNDK